MIISIWHGLHLWRRYWSAAHRGRSYYRHYGCGYNRYGLRRRICRYPLSSLCEVLQQRKLIGVQHRCENTIWRRLAGGKLNIVWDPRRTHTMWLTWVLSLRE